MNARLAIVALVAALAVADVPCSTTLEDPESYKAATFDLSSLAKSSYDFSYSDTSFATTYYARFCGNVPTACSSGAGVCSKGKDGTVINWGLATSQEIVESDDHSAMDKSVLVKLSGGDMLDTTARTAKIYISCDSTSTKSKITSALVSGSVLTLKMTSTAGCGAIPAPEMFFTSPLSEALFGLRTDHNPQTMYVLNSMRSPTLVSTTDDKVYVTQQKNLVSMVRGKWNDQKVVHTDSATISELSASNNTVFYVVGKTLYAMIADGSVISQPITTTGATSGEALDDSHFAWVNGVDQVIHVMDLNGATTSYPIPTACNAPYHLSYSRISGITVLSCPDGKLIAGLVEDMEASYETWTLPSGWTHILSASHYEGELWVLDKTLGLLYSAPRHTLKVYPTTADFSVYDFDFDYD